LCCRKKGRKLWSVPGIPSGIPGIPFVVVDPRAGHGPGNGGFKADSELGVAMRAGYPCYH